MRAQITNQAELRSLAADPKVAAFFAFILGLVVGASAMELTADNPMSTEVSYASNYLLGIAFDDEKAACRALASWARNNRPLDLMLERRGLTTAAWNRAYYRCNGIGVWP